MKTKMKISICAIIIALCLALSVCCFLACGDEDVEPQIPPTEGMTITLQDAYFNGYIDRDDLINAAYYCNGGRSGNEDVIPEDYTPEPKDPDILDEDLEQVILKDWLLRNSYYSVDDVLPFSAIEIYCGKYNDCMIVKVLYEPPIFIDDEKIGCENECIVLSSSENFCATMGGVNFIGNYNHHIAVWYNHSIIVK